MDGAATGDEPWSLSVMAIASTSESGKDGIDTKVSPDEVDTRSFLLSFVDGKHADS